MVFDKPFYLYPYSHFISFFSLLFCKFSSCRFCSCCKVLWKCLIHVLFPLTKAWCLFQFSLNISKHIPWKHKVYIIIISVTAMTIIYLVLCHLYCRKKCRFRSCQHLESLFLPLKKVCVFKKEVIINFINFSSNSQRFCFFILKP